MKNLIRHFPGSVFSALRSEAGSILPMFALSLMAMFGTIAAAVDFGLAYSHRDRLQKSADSAALAAAILLDATETERKQRAANAFNANYADASSATFGLTVDYNGSSQQTYVVATATRKLRTHILPLFGYTELDLKTVVKVPIPRLLDAEVVLVLDYSDSMIANQKYVRMRDAAIQLIDTISLNGTNKRAKFGVVPFAAMVKADLPGWAIRSDVSYTGCTQDRRSPHNGLEASPNGNDDTKWGEVTSAHVCSDMAAAKLDVVPLTNDASSVKAKIGAMRPYKWTHIAAGAEFGWQVISPTGIFGGANPYDPDRTIKVAIILSDGMQTAPGWGPDSTQSTVHAENNLSALCSGMKARQIKVYTIGYDLSDDHTKTLLGDCAGAGRFYDANDIQTGVLSAFVDIGEKVRDQMVRLSQ
ncbi:MAG: VWA domain-containing protein [Alphaproteobacteria bacterium]|nr:VWA domain-containing protein [Alphaproteobacteria bacterium]